MKEFVEYTAAHPWWGVVLLVLLVLTVITMIQASRAGKKRAAERDAIIAKLEKEKALRQKYAVLTEESFEEPDAEKLLAGIAANIQMKLEKTENMNEAFTALPVCAQYIYALQYVLEDSGGNALSQFFRCNGEPLLRTADAAVRDVIGRPLYEFFTQMYAMFDEENEAVSYDPEKIKALDEECLSRKLLSIDNLRSFGRVSSYLHVSKHKLLAIQQYDEPPFERSKDRFTEISFEKAKQIALQALKESYGQVVLNVCTEFEDSWLFGCKHEDGTPLYGPQPVRVYKETGEAQQFDILCFPEFYNTKISVIHF